METHINLLLGVKITYSFNKYVWSTILPGEMMAFRRVAGVAWTNRQTKTKPIMLSERKWKLLVMSDSLWPHGILQARILERVAFPFFRGSSQPRDQTQVFHIAGTFFISWATREAQVRHSHIFYYLIYVNYLK